MRDELNSVFEGVPLGLALGHTREQLLADLDTIASLSGGTLTKRAAAIRARVRNSSIRVGVIGQVKAGKSSMINALTRQSGLLPSDVNPWTTVVTKLHFGHPGGKTSGAVFRFFNDAEWDRLAKRGGRLGELTEGLLEDYKREKLADQVLEMRVRAEARLGTRFATLLGKAHRFDAVTTDLLSHYVAAGDDPEQRDPNPTVGRYADITHSAELYFPQAPFGYPLTLIDTPGVNDPLLIREEITQQSIENSDHFIVVLSAHQTLSRSDIRLIRLLKALNRDRFVVFVNRLDEIRNPGGEYDGVKTRLVDHLRNELDGKEISVVLGSAAWADFAFTGNEEFLDRASLDEFVKARGLEGQIRALDPDGVIADSARVNAFVASGMKDLMEAVSAMVATGPAARTMQAAAADLLAVTRQAVERAEIRLAMTDDQNNEFKPIASAKEVAGIVAQVNLRARDCRTVLAEDAEAIFAAMLYEMADAMDRYIISQRNQMAKLLLRKRRVGQDGLDVDPLRRKLESVFLEGYDRLRIKLIKDANLFEVAVQDALPEKVANRVKSVRFETAGISVLVPQMDALYRTVSVEMQSSWLDRVLGGSSKKVEACLASLRSQLRSICEEIVALNLTSVSALTDRLAEDFRNDMITQLNELAGLTPSGDVYSMEEVQKRHEMREKAKIDLVTAERMVEALSKAQGMLANEDEQAA